MRDFIRKYKYIKFINTYLTDYAIKNDEVLKKMAPSEEMIVTPSFKAHRAVILYAQKTGLSEQVVHDISVRASKKYLEISPAGLELSDAGHKLMDRPLGTLQCLLEELGLAFTLIVSVLIAIIPNLF